MPLKIAMIGAGSIGFTRRLMQDLLAVPEFAGTTFALTDLSKRNLDMVVQLCRRDIGANNLPAKIAATTDRRKAIADADYVICTIRQGGLEAFQTDVDIPLKYGVDQCVGDTICAGGIMYAQRTIPVLLDLCRDMRAVCPDALLINHSNPMAMNSWAVCKAGSMNCPATRASNRAHLCWPLKVQMQQVKVAPSGASRPPWMPGSFRWFRWQLPRKRSGPSRIFGAFGGICHATTVWPFLTAPGMAAC